MPRAASCLCGTCPKCEKRVYMKAYYHSTPERKAKALVLTRYRRLQDEDPEWREKERARNRKRRPAPITTPEKNKARSALNNAVRDGKIVKPDACQKCGEKPGCKRLHGHHPDHSKPLGVLWLCTPCHGKEHRDELR